MVKAERWVHSLPSHLWEEMQILLFFENFNTAFSLPSSQIHVQVHTHGELRGSHGSVGLSRKTTAVLVILTECIIGNQLNRYWRTKKQKRTPRGTGSTCKEICHQQCPGESRKSVGFLQPRSLEETLRAARDPQRPFNSEEGCPPYFWHL